MELEHIIEARYYRKHSAESVYDRLASMTNTEFKGISIGHPEHRDAGSQNNVNCRLYISNADSEQDAINQAESLLQKYGIPFDDIGNIQNYSAHLQKWRVTMTYDPDNLNEARYYGRHSPEQILKRLKEL
ncbi:hypothetical protein LCGC14_1434590, partial [marine sediment metagenome]